ncbi:MAG: CvpA family protein [Deltaproteobacteria bacterium]|nr:CvpA family protein [Deltaproteobacteria bacterium]MBW2360288.1 CvpA family protein [Deltaproteobacteria bacterium]
MWLDIVALVVLALFAGVGALRGGLASGLALASLGVAYAAAITAAPRFAPLAAELTGVSEWLGMALAGSVAFLAAFLVMSLVAKLLRRATAPAEGEGRSARDRFLGGVFGAVRGSLIVLLLSYLAIWVDALRTTGTAPELPELGSSAAASVTESLVEAGVEAMTDDTAGGRVLAHIAARPGQSIAGLQSLFEHPVIHELRSDELFWSYVEHGEVDAALERRGAVALVYDADVRRQLGELGLIDEAAVSDSAVFRAAAVDVLRQVGPRLRGLREDPELQALMRDPEVVAAVQSGNHIALMGHPGFRAVVAKVMEGE